MTAVEKLNAYAKRYDMQKCVDRLGIEMFFVRKLYLSEELSPEQMVEEIERAEKEMGLI